MHGANEWLMTLSFVLGLGLTFAFAIRRVTREAPAGGELPSQAETTRMAVVNAGPYGGGSAKAGPGGAGPAGWTIKGNEDSMLYHTADSPAYDATIAEVWFREEKTAEAAGFARWDSRKDDPEEPEE